MPPDHKIPSREAIDKMLAVARFINHGWESLSERQQQLLDAIPSDEWNRLMLPEWERKTKALREQHPERYQGATLAGYLSHLAQTEGQAYVDEFQANIEANPALKAELERQKDIPPEDDHARLFGAGREIPRRIDKAKFNLRLHRYMNLSKMDQAIIDALPVSTRDALLENDRIENLAMQYAREDPENSEHIVVFSLNPETRWDGHLAQYKEQARDAIAAERQAREQAIMLQRNKEAALSGAGALFISGFSGSGKSYILARLCAENLRRGIGQVIIDPVGGLTTEFFSRIQQQNPEFKDKVIYCPMDGMRVGNETYLPAWPLLHRSSVDEDLYDTVHRFIDVIARTERSFQSAPIMGGTRFSANLTAMGLILAAFGKPLYEAVDMLRHPEQYLDLIDHFLATHPDMWMEVQDLKDFLYPSAGMDDYSKQRFYQDRLRENEPLINRLMPFRMDAKARTMFGNNEPTVDFEQVVSEGKTVLLDFQTARAGRVHEIKLFWVWSLIGEFVDSRTGAGEKAPFSIVMDELSYFTRGSHLDIDTIVEEFTSFIQQKRRNANVRFAGATQELTMLPENMQQACLMIPSQLYGATTDVETAYRLADRFYELDPMLVKQEHYRIQNTQVGRTRTGKPIYVPGASYVDRQEFYPLEEQRYLNSLNFIKLNQGEWLLGAAEGNRPAKQLEKITLGTESCQSVDTAEIQQTKQRLAKRHGIPIRRTVKKKLITPPPSQETKAPELAEEVPKKEEKPNPLLNRKRRRRPT